MLLTLANIGPKASSPNGSGLKSHYEALTRLYLDRIHPFLPIESRAFPVESAFLDWLTGSNSPNARKQTRTPARISPVPVLPVILDGTQGRQLSSTEFATWLGTRRDRGSQHIAFAIGPPDGWSPATLAATRQLTRTHAALILSFGPITMAHDLARLVLAEQLYRACTILQGHPYHSGH